MGTASPVAASRHDVVSSLWLIPRAATIVFILGCCSLFLAWIADWLNESHVRAVTACPACTERSLPCYRSSWPGSLLSLLTLSCSVQSKRFKLVESKSYLLRSPAAQSTPLLSGYDFEKFYFTWLPILAASLASIGLHQMPRPSSPPAWWCGIKRRVSFRGGGHAYAQSAGEARACIAPWPRRASAYKLASFWPSRPGTALPILVFCLHTCS